MPVNTFHFGSQTITTQVSTMVPRALATRAPYIDVVAAMNHSASIDGTGTPTTKRIASTNNVACPNAIASGIARRPRTSERRDTSIPVAHWCARSFTAAATASWSSSSSDRFGS